MRRARVVVVEEELELPELEEIAIGDLKVDHQQTGRELALIRINKKLGPELIYHRVCHPPS